MRFWDASAVVPLLVRQEHSDDALARYRQDDDVIAWWGTRVECDSAIARLEREGTITSDQVEQAFARLDRLARAWSEVLPHAGLRPLARRLLRTHALAAGDALQLAAAISASEQDPASLPFVCFDDRLRRAARREGFPPEPGARGSL